ncbi:MAG: tRNA lysidine(34) synthetase TilS [Legionella sp.]|nr:MAG: tRNA lysidine(34) synthetase TilS [Legionella sp.]
MSLLQNWQQRLIQYEQLYVGLSGGLDSTVLLDAVSACPALKDKITAIHVHHGISSHADQWLVHCEQYCQRIGVPIVTHRVAIGLGANLEERARDARYQVFESYLNQNAALLLAHHQDDQSETVLLNLLRGAGIDGLSAMGEERVCGQGVVLRPFLQYPRATLELYARTHTLEWVEDETNGSDQWSRSYLRHYIMPLLKEKWPGATATIATAAAHCQQAKVNLEALAWLDHPQMALKTLQCTPEVLARPDRLQNVLRVWLKCHVQQALSTEQLRQIIDTVLFAREDATPCVRIQHLVIRRYRQRLYLCDEKNLVVSDQIWQNFPNPLRLFQHSYLMAQPDPSGISIPENSQIEIKYRRGGEQFHWRGQTKCLKKLFQDWKIPPWERAHVPLLYVNDCLMAVIGYAVTDLILFLGPSERYTMVLNREHDATTN